MIKKIFRNKHLISNLAIIAILVSLSIISFVGVGVTGAFSEKTDKPIYRGNPLNNSVSMMINVYWGTEFLDGMLNVLKEKDVKTTFFIGGTWANDNPEMLKRIIADGHEVGNHGYFHRDHDKLSYEKNLEEIKTCHVTVKSITGYEMSLFAPPSGAFSEATMRAAKDLNYKTIMWSRDTIDWRDKDAEICFTRATKDIKGGELILMHPTEHTLSALPRIIDYYKAQSLKPTTVSATLL